MSSLQRSCHAVVWVLLCGVPFGAVADAQTATAVPAEVAEVGAGWAALARGDVNGASAAAAGALGRYPKSVGAANLLVQSETLRLGATAGLNAYEQWIGARQIEDPYLLRVIALGMLREAARTSNSGDVRRDAFRALSADGDVATLSDLGQSAQAGGLIELQILGALGSESAVRSLIGALQNTPGDRGRVINALLETRSPLVVAPLVEVLADTNPYNRASAADALGKLGAQQAAPRLRALLADTNFSVRFAAAAALYRLHDGAGLPILREVQNSEYPMLRAQALEAMAVDVDPSWISDVRRLLADDDPQVRLLAARLIAPYDADAASAAFQALLSDNNVAIRDVSGQVFVEKVVSDYPSLRRFLRSSDALTRVHSAARVLELTR